MDKVTHIYIRSGDTCDVSSRSDTLEETTDILQNSYGEPCEWLLQAAPEVWSSRGQTFVEPFLSVTASHVDIGADTVITNTACSNSSSVMVVNKDHTDPKLLSFLRGTQNTVNKLAVTESELTYASKMQLNPIQSMGRETGKGFNKYYKFNDKNVENYVIESTECLQEHLLSEKDVTFTINSDIVDNHLKQRDLTVSCNSELEVPTSGSKNMIMKNMHQGLFESVRWPARHCTDHIMLETEAIWPTTDHLQSSNKDSSLGMSSLQSEATLKTSNVRSVIWPHALVNEDIDEFVSADNIFVSKFLIGFCKILALKPEETKGRLNLLHATSLVYESLSSWPEARAFHNAILVNIEQYQLNWTTDFVSLSNDFLMKLMSGEMKHENQRNETVIDKIVSSIDKNQGCPIKLSSEIKKQGCSSKTQVKERVSDNNDIIVRNEYSEDTPANEEETSVDDCHFEIHTCPICSIGFSVKDDLNIHMKTHTGEQDSITSVPKNNSNSERVRRGRSHISAETKTEIAKDCIKLGVAKTKQKWSLNLGYPVPKSSICDWRTKYLKELEDIDGILDMLVDKKQGRLGKTKTIKYESQNDVVIIENEYSDDTPTVEKETSLGYCHLEIHTCPICSIGFSLEDDLNIHMKTHTEKQDSITSLPENDSYSGRIRQGQSRISAEIKTEIAKDCIKLGVTKTKQKWSQILGHSVPKSSICGWRNKYLEQSQNVGGVLIQTHTCPICLVGFKLKDDLSIHMKTHTSEKDSITLVHQSYSNSGNDWRGQSRISPEIKNEIAKDCIKLGVAKAQQKWSQIFGRSIPKSSICGWRTKYQIESELHKTMENNSHNEIVGNKFSKETPNNEEETSIDNCHTKKHICHICSIGFSLNDDLDIHMKSHTVETSLPEDDSYSVKVWKRKLKLSAEIRTKIAKDSVMLGPTKANRKWSHLLGHTISRTSVRKWKRKYLDQLQEAGGHIDKLVDKKGGRPRKNIKAIERNSKAIQKNRYRDEIIARIVKRNQRTIYKCKISAENKRKIVTDCITLGPTKAKLKWFQLLGHSIPESTIRSWKREYLNQSQEQEHMITELQNKTKSKKIRKGRPSVYNSRISNEIRTEIAKDCIKMGNVKARLKWSQQVGYSIPISSIHTWKVNYLKCLQEDKLVDDKQCITDTIQTIECKLENDEIIVKTDDSGQNMIHAGEQDNIIQEPQKEIKSRRVRKARLGVYNSKMDNEIRTEIAKDCIKLGNAQTKIKWSQQLGYTIPVSNIHTRKVNYLKQSQDDMHMDNKEFETEKIQVIESESLNDEIIVRSIDSGDTVTLPSEKIK